jgi:hypothetical protein
VTFAQFRPSKRAEAPPPEVSGATVFVRTISTPPGLPWEQARMADLDARSGAPLPLSDVVYRLGRLESWRPGRASRYFACYVRAREVGERLRASAMVDGRPVTLEFVSSAERARGLRRAAAIAAASAVTGLLVVAALVSALTVRSGSEARLKQIDSAIDARLRQARLIEGLVVQTGLLNAAHVRDQSVSDFLGDLAWVSRSRTPGAHIDILHWNHGYMGMETRGDTPPLGLVDRPVVKADRPLRPGVWLWGVGPPAAGPSLGAPPAQARPPAEREAGP